MRRIKHTIIASVGFLLIIPFAINIIFIGPSLYLTILDFIGLILLIFGGPMFVFGLTKFFMTGVSIGSNSQDGLNIDRIRYTVETDSRRNNK